MKMLTKEKMLKALEEGKRVTHKDDLSREFYELVDGNLIEEKGNVLSDDPYEYFEDAPKTGWLIVEIE